MATVWFGITSRGLGGYLKGFAEPSWVMLPLNLANAMSPGQVKEVMKCFMV